MKEWMTRKKYKIQRWMIGRYGTDELSVFLLRVAIAVMLIACVPKLNSIMWLGWTLSFIAVYRTCSKKIVARSRERDLFLAKTAKIRSRLGTYKRMWNERKTHRYFKCNKCHSFVRVPKNRGRIEITCTKCGNKMIRKS